MDKHLILRGSFLYKLINLRNNISQESNFSEAKKTLFCDLFLQSELLIKRINNIKNPLLESGMSNSHVSLNF
jgi:hypothetical protein